MSKIEIPQPKGRGLRLYCKHCGYKFGGLLNCELITAQDTDRAYLCPKCGKNICAFDRDDPSLENGWFKLLL